MADNKLTSLTRIDTFQDDALLYIVDNGFSRSIEIKDVFSNLNNPTLKGEVSFDSNVQIMSEGGIINIGNPITLLHIDTDTHNISIPQGNDGQLKVIIVTQYSGGEFILTGNIIGNETIIFEEKGQSALLISIANKWVKL